ncbi:cation efflux family-domain-containing protein [Truncatella angustata]|uniref:Zinc transporter n=1 Tax=Truncatella angustata TaxID=152316 RepID=A0A9P8UU98_9PEZI|nr:cation efflux family-domain-containing protein [Truncatella angustata]KAH6658343.1 cation efflux family-domain-containing protein [Truncatella angustata]
MAPGGHRPTPIPIPVISPSIELSPSSPEQANRPRTRSTSRSKSYHKSNTSAPLLHLPREPLEQSRDQEAYHRFEEPFYDPNRLSPVAATFQQSSGLLSPTYFSNMASNGSAGHGATFTKENTPPIEIPSAAPNPFNFQTQVISTSPVKPNVGQRRGHRYKHSSISAQHQIFLEPPPRPPLALPRDLPIPTWREAWKSMSTDQRRRLYWCCCHLGVAFSIFISAHNSLAMTALSHLVFFDVGSALIGVTVDVLGNFEVWKRSSIRHPFGLERSEVLAGFATSVFLIFGGFDLVSHNLKHVLEGLGDHESHHPDPHSHGPRVQPGHLDITSLVAIIATLVSAYGLKNHGRISRIMRTSYLASLPSILSNPFHFLTLSTAFLLLLLPLLSIPIYAWLDSAVCGLVAISMFALGTRLAIAQGLMLLMSYGGRSGTSSKHKDVGVANIVSEIETEPSVERVEEAQFWQVHYGLCMANLKLCVSKGCDDGALSKLRTRISNLVQNRLGEGYGKGNSLRWEVTLQTRTDAK